MQGTCTRAHTPTHTTHPSPQHTHLCLQAPAWSWCTTTTGRPPRPPACTRIPTYLRTYLHSRARAPGLCVQAWRFFRQRIAYEEHYLRKIFGDGYAAYAARTPTLLPFVP